MIDMEAMRAELELDEGRESMMYKCSADKLTIGVGHNLEANPLPGAVIDLLLECDISEVMSQLIRHQFYASLDPIRKRVIINMAFNMGVSGVLKFKDTIAAINEGDYEEAAAQMMDSKWYRQVGDRAERLCQMMETGHSLNSI